MRMMKVEVPLCHCHTSFKDESTTEVASLADFQRMAPSLPMTFGVFEKGA